LSGNFRNVVLEKDGEDHVVLEKDAEDHVDRSRQK
jgi:hypothetical protein